MLYFSSSWSLQLCSLRPGINRIDRPVDPEIFSPAVKPGAEALFQYSCTVGPTNFCNDNPRFIIRVDLKTRDFPTMVSIYLMQRHYLPPDNGTG
jgi:hypothetical protein